MSVVDMKRLSRGLAVGLCSLLVVTPARASDKAAGLAKCAGSPPAGVPQLASYNDIQVPARYWIDVSWRDRKWQPRTTCRCRTTMRRGWS